MKHLSRRTFLQTATAALLTFQSRLARPEAYGADELILIGTQTGSQTGSQTGAQQSITSNGIYAYCFHSKRGELEQIGLAAQTPSPTFLTLTPHGKTVVTVNEIDSYRGKKSGAVSSFALDRRSMQLRPISQMSSVGAGPCHICVDATGRCVLVANYTGGSIASYRLTAEGTLSEAVSFFQYTGSGPDKARQEAPHAHRVTVAPGNRFVLVNDLGLDTIHCYRLDSATARLIPKESSNWRAPAGSGPRALQFHPNGRWAYCVTEMKSTVILLKWDGIGGTFQTIQEVPLLPEGYIGSTGAADIVLDRTGRFAYAANRLNDFIVTFAVSPTDGRLSLLERTPCAGKTPRHLALDKTERWLLLAYQDSDAIGVIARDAKTGKLTNDTKSFPLARPQCLRFL